MSRNIEVGPVKALPVVEIFVDGSCLKNPGPGGYAGLMRFQGKETTFTKGFNETTNNRMELMAAIAALEKLKTNRFSVRITTDSSYVQKGATQFLPTWKARQWLKADKKPLLNVDLWMRLDTLLATYAVEWQWIAGHAGHKENEWCDQAAREAAKLGPHHIDDYYEQGKTL